MDNLRNTLWIELRKAWRSRVPLATTLGFLMVPVVCAVMMIIFKDPEFARKAGLISMKANLMGGTADWPTYMNMLAQAIAIGGIMLFSIIESWVFGREFVDGTLKDWLAVPVPRGSILLAKFIVTGAWAASMVIMVYGISMGLGALIGLPQGSPQVILSGSRVLLVSTLLVMGVVTPFALLASIGRGYLLSIGITILAVALANVMGILGWGSQFPWAVPAFYANMAGKGLAIEPVGYWIVLLTGLLGIIGTVVWWRYADQNR